MKIKVTTFILFIACSTVLLAQSKSGKKDLEGLRAATVSEIYLKEFYLFFVPSQASKPIIKEEVPIYDHNYNKLSAKKANDLLMSSYQLSDANAKRHEITYMVDEYTDVKALVFKKVKKEDTFHEKVLEIYPSGQKKMHKRFNEYIQEMFKKKNSVKRNAEYSKRKVDSFSLTDIQGKEYNLSSLRDKLIVLNFWFIACKPCVSEMPELNELQQKYKDNKKVVFIAVTFDNKENVKKFLEKTPFNYNHVVNETDFISKMGVSSYPTNMIINGNNGEVVIEFSGYGGGVIETLEEELNFFIKNF